jgi:hypothetical protein
MDSQCLENSPVEIRSERVRNIVGNIPPALIRYGLSIIFSVLVLLIMGSALLNYTPQYSVQANITSENGTTMVLLKIPADLKRQISPGHKVLLDLKSIPDLHNYKIETTIIEIDSILHISNKGGYYQARLSNSHKINHITIDDPTNASAIVFGQPQSVLKYVIKELFPVKD